MGDHGRTAVAVPETLVRSSLCPPVLIHLPATKECEPCPKGAPPCPTQPRIPGSLQTKVKGMIKVIMEDLELVPDNQKDRVNELKEMRGMGMRRKSGALCPLGLPGPFFLGPSHFPTPGKLQKDSYRWTFALVAPEKSFHTFFFQSGENQLEFKWMDLRW